MNKILIVPDIHGRDFWVEPCQKWQGPIVFLGDYHDPYSSIPGQPSQQQSLENLQKLVDFVTNREKNDPYSTICLWGNHDESYRTGLGKCRFDYTNQDKIRNLLEQLKPQICYEVWDDKDNPTHKYLFSHAGITQNWMDKRHLTLDKLIKDFADNKSCLYLNDIPWSRGGNTRFGSCIWNDVRDYIVSDWLPEYYQIFGHTLSKDEVIRYDFAMLDCCRTFILDTKTKEIEEWSTI